MRLTTEATRVLKQIGEGILNVQRMCAMHQIAPMHIAINVDLKREKDAIWCAEALRDFLVQHRYDILPHIEVGKLAKKYQQSLSLSRVEIHIMPLSLDKLLYEHDVSLHRQAMQIDHSFSNDSGSRSWGDWARDFGSHCQKLCDDEELTLRTDPRVSLCLQTLASHIQHHVGDGMDPMAMSIIYPKPLSEDPRVKSLDHTLHNQAHIIRTGLHLAHSSSLLWRSTLSRLISMIEGSDSLLAATDPRVVTCLRVAQSAMKQIDGAAPKPHEGDGEDSAAETATQAALSTDVEEFECPDDKAAVRELCEGMDALAAQITAPHMSLGVDSLLEQDHNTNSKALRYVN